MIFMTVYYFIIDFKSHFRIERHTFEQCMQSFGRAFLENHNSPKLPPNKQFAIALWFFGNQEVYRLVIKTHSFNFSVLYNITYKFSYIFLIILILFSRFIRESISVTYFCQQIFL